LFSFDERLFSFDEHAVNERSFSFDDHAVNERSYSFVVNEC
jgi:hypothetical protein